MYEYTLQGTVYGDRIQNMLGQHHKVINAGDGGMKRVIRRMQPDNQAQVIIHERHQFLTARAP